MRTATIVIAIDGHGRVLWVSDWHPGVNPADVIGWPCWRGSIGEARLRDFHDRCMSGETVRDVVVHEAGDEPVTWRVEWHPVQWGPVRCIVKTRAVNQRLQRLSARHRDILRCVYDGMSAGETARRLGISTATATKRRNRIRRLLGLAESEPLTQVASQLFGPL